MGKKTLLHHCGELENVRLWSVVDVLVSNVDKKHASDELPVTFCNYTHVYYNRYLTMSLSYDNGTATKAEVERFRLLVGDVVITKDSEQADDIGIAACVTDDIHNLVCGYHLAILRPEQDRLIAFFS